MATNPTLDPQELLHVFLAHLKAGRKQEANRVLAQALRQDPSKAAAYSLLIGGLLAQNGQYEEAVPLYQEAMRLKPNEPASYFYLGAAYHALKRERESEQVWDELAKRFPSHALDHYQKALRLLKQNALANAKRELEFALPLIEPDNPIRSDIQKTLLVIDKQVKAEYLGSE